MVDTVTSNVLYNGPRYYAVHLTGISDGTGESTVVKVDKSGLVSADGTEPNTLTLIEARWNMQGYTYITLSWDHTTDVTIDVLSGEGAYSIESLGGLRDAGTGETGDVLLTTVGHTSGDTYSITLVFRKEA